MHVLITACLCRSSAGLSAEMDDLDMDDEDEGEPEEEGGDGRFVPLREDAVKCFKEHVGKESVLL